MKFATVLPFFLSLANAESYIDKVQDTGSVATASGAETKKKRYESKVDKIARGSPLTRKTPARGHHIRAMCTLKDFDRNEIIKRVRSNRAILLLQKWTLYPTICIISVFPTVWDEHVQSRACLYHRCNHER